jgi:hypothetical protein
VVRLHGRAACSRCTGSADRRRRHRLDVLSPLQHALFDLGGHPGRARRLHQRLRFDSDRRQLHGHRAPHAGAGDDLVPAAAVRLGSVRHQPDHGARHAGGGDHARAAGARARSSTSASSTPPRGATRSSSSTSSGSTRTRRLHHDPAGDGGDLRAHRRLRAQAHLRLHTPSPSRRSASLSSASWSGATTCTSPASRSTPAWSSRCSPCWSRSPRRSRSSTGPSPSTRGRWRSRCRCSTPWASSGCSRSAA